jgi:hypothetical protein
MDVVIEKRRGTKTAHTRYRNTLYRNVIESRVKIQQNSGVSLDALKLPSRYFATAAQLTATQLRSRVAFDPFAFDERGQICDLIDRPLLPTHAEPTRTGEIFEIRGCTCRPGLAAGASANDGQEAEGPSNAASELWLVVNPIGRFQTTNAPTWHWGLS